MSKISKSLLNKKISPSGLKFGFIGLGNMGSGIVKNLLNSGHTVIVWNRTPEKVITYFIQEYVKEIIILIMGFGENMSTFIYNKIWLNSSQTQISTHY